MSRSSGACRTELVAARLAAPRLAEDIRPLEREVEALREATAAGDVDGQIKHSVEFHREIVRAAHNSVLLHTWESLGVEVWTALSVRWLNMELHAKVADHWAITQAFRNRPPRRPDAQRPRAQLRRGGTALPRLRELTRSSPKLFSAICENRGLPVKSY